MKKKINVSLIGSNFALKGYLPVIKKIKRLDLKIICSRNIFSIKENFKDINNIELEKNWKNVFKKNIDLIVCAVPPLVQEKIIKYNLIYKKKIIFEKPISSKYSFSENLVKKIKEKKIKCEVNLIFLNHALFHEVKNIIKKRELGKVKHYRIKWNFSILDLNKKIESWKTNEKKGGGIKNIFLTHVLSYSEFFFGKNNLKDFNFSTIDFKRIKYKNSISCNIENPNSVNGKIDIYTKQSGKQNHIIKIFFENGCVELFTKSNDWTKNFVLKVVKNGKSKLKYNNLNNNKKFKDGRSDQVHLLFAKFLKRSNYSNINYCLNAERINHKIN